MKSTFTATDNLYISNAYSSTIREFFQKIISTIETNTVICVHPSVYTVFIHLRVKSICSFTSINPVIIHINRLRKIIYLSLEAFHANTASYSSGVSGLVPENTKEKKTSACEATIERLLKICAISPTYILTSQLLSWLQNGQLNCVSNGSIALTFGGGFLLLFFLPILSYTISSVNSFFKDY